MEEMKHYKCAICGRFYSNIKDRIECETRCIESQEALEEQMKEDKKKAKMEAESAINHELDNLIAQYDKVAHMIADYYEKYENEDIYDKVVNRYIPRSFFNFIF